MIEIKDLLTKFENILFSGENKKEIIRKVVSEILKIDISREDIEIKNNILYLNIKPIYKNEIFLKQDQIFFKLKKSLGKKTPRDIR